ncbi:transmembrane amino acid transporter [Nitzschia inconspicua]|uniref:Transmembrane amino acid transporter n=1 Tax=Nitzschia inconspicua TaxID=303405 RepID=A0A9K3KHD5_9STRA|nr:transmembrane amino acid transporter [Nitzschia inconspicua]
MNVSWKSRQIPTCGETKTLASPGRHLFYVIVALLCLRVERTSAFVHKQSRRTIRRDSKRFHCHSTVSSYKFYSKRVQFTTAHFRASASDDQTNKSGGTASVPNLVISLVKSIVGAGVLALPASIAGLGQIEASAGLLLPATVILIAIGAINAYFFRLVGRVCRMTGATSYQDAWDKTVALENSNIESSSKSSLIAIVVTLKTVLSCLAFSIILADSFQSIAVASGFQDATRGQALMAVTTMILLPLCTFLKDLKALTPFSFLGLLGVGATIVSMIYRCFDGSYRDGGAFALSTQTQPLLASTENNLLSFDNFNAFGGLVLACTLATAFVAHYNAPRFYNELENNTEGRFDSVVSWSYMISGTIFMIVAASGFLTFGLASSGFILNSYSPFDPLITFSRVALAFSIALTYPLPFFGLRDGVLDILQIPQDQRSDSYITILSIGLLLGVTLAAYFVKDVALVLSVGGGTFSTAISSVIPTLMFRSAVKHQDWKKNDNTSPESQNAFDAQLSNVLMWICVAIGASGVAIALQNGFR